MSRQADTPRAVEHFKLLLGKIPENMLKETVRLNAHTKILYLRPTILASFLDRFALPRKHGGTPSLRIKVTPQEVVFIVRGAHALTALHNLQLPTYTQGAGSYMFEEEDDLTLVAHVTHNELKRTLQEVYGKNMSYGHSTIAKLGEHLGTSTVTRVNATKIRIKNAYKKGQKNR